jgi:hypothetical protein
MEGKWGEIIDRPSSDLVEIRWYDTTAAMSGDDFNAWLSVFAGCVETKKRSRCLVDSVQFKMPMVRMNSGWRDENIIPRYNAAGVVKFAFIMPAGMPRIGAEPARAGPGTFPTGYFGERSFAVAWLAESTT